MKMYQIAERLRIWRMSLGLSALERAQWKRMRTVLSRPEYEGFAIVAAQYLTLKAIKEREERKAIPEKKARTGDNILILPNPYAFADIESSEKRMSADRLNRWMELKHSLNGLESPVLFEIVRRYAVYKHPIRVNISYGETE